MEKDSSWHGITYYSRYTEQDKHRDEGILRFKICLDRVSSGDTKQDCKAALSRWEDFLVNFELELPQVDSVYAQVDNF